MTKKDKNDTPDHSGQTLFDYIVENPDAFAVNLAKTLEQTGVAMTDVLQTKKPEQLTSSDPTLEDMVKTLSQVADYWAADPNRAVDAQAKIGAGFMSLLTSSFQKAANPAANPAIEPAPRDRRFEDEDWQRLQYFDFLKQAYLLTSQWARELVDDAEDLDEKTRHKAEFYIEQLSAAFSPSNYLATNPQLLRETLQSQGENLASGAKMLAEDIAAGAGTLKLRQATPGDMEVGKTLGNTPGKVVFENELMQLIQYAPTTTKVLKRPLVIIPPWINKFYILDLTPAKSYVKWCVDQGHTVFLVSWVNPDQSLRDKDWEDYITDGIWAAVDQALEITRSDKVNTLGYCAGGTLLSVALSLMGANKDDRIASATMLTTQVDFRYAGDLLVFIDDEKVERMEAEMAETGYFDGKKMATTFNMLRSSELIWPYMVNNYLRGKQPAAFDLLLWNSDSTRMTEANHSYYVRNCYLDNNLSRNKAKLFGQTIDLSNVNVPIYSLATELDHIAPAKSVYLGTQYYGGPVEFVLGGSGHIAGVVNPPAKNKYQYWTGGRPVGDLDTWRQDADMHEGSWWPHWHAWLAGLDDRQVAARKIQKKREIEDAPGRYVLVK